MLILRSLQSFSIGDIPSLDTSLMKKLFLLLCFAFGVSLLANPQQIVFPGGVLGTTIWSGSSFTSLASWRMEFRAKFTNPGSNFPLVISFASSYKFQYDNAPEIRFVDNIDGITSNQLTIPIVFGEDAVFRVTKSAATNTITFEKWKVDGTNYQAQSSTMTTPQVGGFGAVTFGDPTLASGTMAFFNFWTTLVPINSQPPYGQFVGDLASYQFNGSGADGSTHGNNLAGVGSSTYTTATTYAPVCQLPPQSSFPSGSTQTFTTLSYPLDGSNSLSAFSYQQVNAGNVSSFNPSASVPTLVINYTARSTLTFGTPTASSTTVNNFVAPTLSNPGSYVIGLTVTQAGGSTTTNSCAQKYGAVPVDANGIVQIANPTHAAILIKPIASYANTLTNYEQQGALFSQQIAAKMANSGLNPGLPVAWNNATSGCTVTVSPNSNAMVGTGAGCHWTTEFCQGPSSPTVAKSINGGPPYIIVWYNIGTLIFSSSQTGRYPLTIGSCTDDTHMTTSSPSSGVWPHATGSAADPYYAPGTYSYAYVDGGVTGGAQSIGGWLQGNSPGNYYDNSDAAYSQFYRTDIDDNLVLARNIRNAWISYPFGIDKGVPYASTWGNNNGGTLILQSRSLSLSGLYLGNADSPAFDYTPSLNAITDYLAAQGGGDGVCSSPCQVTELRQNGYNLMYYSFCALFDQTGHAATCRGYASSDMTNRWNTNTCGGITNACGRQPGGNWINLGEGTYASWDGGTYGTVTVTDGSPNVVMGGGGTWNASTVGNSAASSPPYNAIWLTHISPSTIPISNTQGDPTGYQVYYLNSSTLRLVDQNGGSVNYNSGICPTGCTVGWQIASIVGLGTQGFEVGMPGRAFYFMSKALATSDPTNAGRAAPYTLGFSQWFAANGLNSTGGTYYGIGFANCLPPTSDSYNCNSGGSTIAARDLNGEALNLITHALLLNPGNAGLIATGTAMMNSMWACPPDPRTIGGSCILPDVTSFMYTGQTPKWYGYYWGFGRNYLLLGAVAGTPSGLVLPGNLVLPSNLVIHEARARWKSRDILKWPPLELRLPTNLRTTAAKISEIDIRW